MQKARPIIPAGACPVLEFLYEDRKITASGRETTDTDPGLAMVEGRLFARNLYSEHELLPDRVADKPRCMRPHLVKNVLGRVDRKLRNERR